MDTPIPMLPRLDLVPVADAMHAGLVSCDPSAPLTDLARIFADERIHCVVVNGVARAPASASRWGIVSDRDLMRALDATDESVTAGVLAVTALVTVEPQERLDRVVQLMASYDVTHVLVVEGDYPVGIVSALDVARVAAGV